MKRREYMIDAVGGLTVTAGCSEISGMIERPEVVGSKEFDLQPESFTRTELDFSGYRGALEYDVEAEHGAGIFVMSLYDIDGEETTRTILYLTPGNSKERGTIQLTNETLEVLVHADRDDLGLSLTFDFEIHES